MSVTKKRCKVYCVKYQTIVLPTITGHSAPCEVDERSVTASNSHIEDLRIVYIIYWFIQFLNFQFIKLILINYRLF